MQQEILTSPSEEMKLNILRGRYTISKGSGKEATERGFVRNEENQTEKDRSETL